jgi:hypothetical protein
LDLQLTATDTSYWTALNPNISLLKTSKLINGRFLYRLNIHAPGCALLRDDEDLYLAAIRRNTMSKNYNYGGSWHARKNGEISDNQIHFLQTIRDYLETKVKPRGGRETFKLRIEEPDIQFYAETQSELKDLVSIIKDPKCITSFMCPENEATRKLLLEGYVLRRKEFEWPYRVVIRDGRFSSETKQQMANYLRNLGDEHVRVPEGVWKHLEKGGWIWGGYIYIKDKNLANMFAMIDPNFVAKIEEFKTPVPGK